MKRTRLKRSGKKTTAWERTRRKLKVKFEAMGITSCEFNFPRCTPNDYLSFAHSLKRVDIKTQEQLEEVAVACFSCHSILDLNMTHEGMAEAVRTVIQQRSQREREAA